MDRIEHTYMPWLFQEEQNDNNDSDRATAAASEAPRQRSTQETNALYPTREQILNQLRNLADQATTNAALEVLRVPATPLQAELPQMTHIQGFTGALGRNPARPAEPVTPQQNRPLFPQNIGLSYSERLQELVNQAIGDDDAAQRIVLDTSEYQQMTEEQVHFQVQVRERFSRLFSRTLNQTMSIDVSLKELEEQPEKVLHDLYEKLTPETNNLSLKFLREDGSHVNGDDEGGPSRVLLNRLFEGLVSRSSLSFKEETGGALPIVKSDNEMRSYRAIGRLMKLCLDNEEYIIGSHFDQGFFDALAAGNGSTLDIYRALHKNNEIIAKMFQEGIHETLMEYVNADQTIPAIQCIAKELNTQTDGTTLKKAIQGEISKELLKERVTCAIPLREHFMQWVDEASPQLIERFIEVVTGSKTLGTRRITLVNNKETPETLPTFHTCGQVVRMPIYPSYDHFKAKLEYALEGALGDGGFQFA